jgi:hypothetical protein
MKKQTALEWLYTKLDMLSTRDEVADLVYKLEEHAKAMEKEQIVDAFNEENHGFNGWKRVDLSGEQYYNETYGGDK